MGFGMCDHEMGFFTGSVYNLITATQKLNIERPLHNPVTKEKSDKIFLLEAVNAVNSRLLTSFPTKSRMILDLFTRYLNYAKVSDRSTLINYLANQLIILNTDFNLAPFRQLAK
jgi:hypothetical protein